MVAKCPNRLNSQIQRGQRVIYKIILEIFQGISRRRGGIRRRAEVKLEQLYVIKIEHPLWIYVVTFDTRWACQRDWWEYVDCCHQLLCNVHIHWNCYWPIPFFCFLRIHTCHCWNHYCPRLSRLIHGRHCLYWNRIHNDQCWGYPLPCPCYRSW